MFLWGHVKYTVIVVQTLHTVTHLWGNCEHMQQPLKSLNLKYLLSNFGFRAIVLAPFSTFWAANIVFETTLLFDQTVFQC